MNDPQTAALTNALIRITELEAALRKRDATIEAMRALLADSAVCRACMGRRGQVDAGQAVAADSAQPGEAGIGVSGDYFRCYGGTD